jgi:hypothetical protein
MPGLQILWIVGTILAYFGALLLDILAGILDPCCPVKSETGSEGDDRRTNRATKQIKQCDTAS